MRASSAHEVWTTCDLSAGTYSLSSHDSKFSPQPPSLSRCSTSQQQPACTSAAYSESTLYTHTDSKIAQSVERWALDRKVPGSNPVRVDSAFHPSWSIKCAEVTGSLCWGLIHPTENVCNLELYSLAQGYRKGMSSSTLWLLVLCSISPLPYTHTTLYRVLQTLVWIHSVHKYHWVDDPSANNSLPVPLQCTPSPHGIHTTMNTPCMHTPPRIVYYAH